MESTTKQAFVYVVAEHEYGPCKIGISENPSRRVASLNIGNFRQLYICFCLKAGDKKRAHLIEQETHGILRDWHERGEWFDLAADEAAYVITVVDGVIPQ